MCARGWRNRRTFRTCSPSGSRRRRRRESSIASRLDASAAIIATLHDKRGAQPTTIGETSEKESRRVLQEKLDAYAAQARKEEGKRERLMREAGEATDRARDERDIREWVRVMAERAASFGRADQRAALMALGAQVTVWRTDYVHPDGWPQRYRVTLNSPASAVNQ